MKIQLGSLLKVAGMILAALSSTAVSQTSNLKSHETQGANRKGKSLFESSCAMCHGLDGTGGEHAPSIGRASAAKSKPDSQLARILRDGIPGKGMPSFNRLGDRKLGSILSYMRFLQGKNGARFISGDPARGQQLFFGKGQWADCHAMHGEGRFLSTDLSDFAYDHDPSDIRAAVIDPQEQEAERHVLARVTTNSGQQCSGVIRNENNTSLQIQDTQGQFCLFLKYDLQTIERSPTPSMPGDYRQRMSPAEIEDLVSYIVQQSPSPQPAAAEPAGHERKH